MSFSLFVAIGLVLGCVLCRNRPEIEYEKHSKRKYLDKNKKEGNLRVNIEYVNLEKLLIQLKEKTIKNTKQN